LKSIAFVGSPLGRGGGIAETLASDESENKNTILQRVTKITKTRLGTNDGRYVHIISIRKYTCDVKLFSVRRGRQWDRKRTFSVPYLDRRSCRRRMTSKRISLTSRRPNDVSKRSDNCTRIEKPVVPLKTNNIRNNIRTKGLNSRRPFFPDRFFFVFRNQF